MKLKKILLIDDDEKIGSLLKAILLKYGYDLYHALAPSEGLKLLNKRQPELVILDIMLPEMDGLEVCKKIRSKSDIPILFLSARGDTTDRIIGLKIGGDDYLPKPFEPQELLARIESILRRSQRLNKDISSDPIKIDSNKMEASLMGQKMDLTSMEFQALSYLIENSHRIVSRDELLNFTQGIETEAYNRSIDILISRLRQKLKDDPKHPIYIKTIRGSGYRFIGGQHES